MHIKFVFGRARAPRRRGARRGSRGLVIWNLECVNVGVFLVVWNLECVWVRDEGDEVGQEGDEVGQERRWLYDEAERTPQDEVQRRRHCHETPWRALPHRFVFEQIQPLIFVQVKLLGTVLETAGGHPRLDARSLLVTKRPLDGFYIRIRQAHRVGGFPHEQGLSRVVRLLGAK